ncbi:MAG: aspartate aminotransferase family protein [Chitinophagaceae bacterium]|nr:aspartate aminotransferase family protein [Chitinophagaceae bacterium]
MQNKGYQQSALLLERAKKVLAGGVSSEFRRYNHPHALFYTHGKGARIYDVDGNEYLDFTLSQGPLILGHSHPHVLQSILEYSSSGQLFAGQHIKELELAEKIQSIIPGAELMRFCLDGSEAVQAAFRLARAKTGKKKFLRFEGHYHGWLDNVAWGLSAPSAEALGNRENPNVYPWTSGVPDSARDEFMVLPWNDAELLQQVVSEHHRDIAAIITEPVMCNNGCIEPEPGFLQAIRQVCNSYNITFILDEVITGFRLALGGAQEHYMVSPDLSILAKAIGSGYPISVIAGKRAWTGLMETGEVIQAGTMNAGNATVAAAIATIEVLEKESPYERMFALGNRLKEGIQLSAKKWNQDLLVQGPGPMINTSFTRLNKIKDYRDTLTCDKQKLNRFILGLQQRNIRVIGRGLWYISAIHTEQDIEEAIKAVDDVLSEM